MSFTLTSYGAAGEVTGSQHVLETEKGTRILLDCGMFQGKREEAMAKNCKFGFDPKSIEAVVLSHAHIDHTGLTPKLCKEGFSGRIYCSKGTKELSHAMLEDSAHIQQEDERFMSRHKTIENPLKDMCMPLYTPADVEKCWQQFEGVDYGERLEIADDLTVTLMNAGHVFGSAIIIVEVQTSEGMKKIVFTGDLGRKNMPIIDDPDFPESADILMIESTYGDRAHEGVSSIEEDLAEIISKTAARGGKIIIPAFALERTQEMILRLENLVHSKKIPNLPIYIDSPLAGRLTKVFEQFPEYYDEDMKKRAEEHGQVFSFKNLRFTETVESSKELNYIKHPCIIMAGSGMCENGRVRHHLKNTIESRRNSVLIVGYQAVNTLGRKLVEGEKEVKILGKTYDVNAEIIVFKSLSAHADMHDLDEYVKSIKGLSHVYLIHGEQSSREAFAERIKGFAPDLKITMTMPGEVNEL